MHGSTPEPRFLGQSLPYEDGAEAQVLEVLRQAEDRGPTSDELADKIIDWPTRYHFSRQRSNLLRPLSIGPGLRILEVGAGTGSISRYLGETGAQVLSLEGNASRARAAAARCADLDTVEVVCGPLQLLDTEERFDLVVVVGVLEYASAEVGGGGGATAFLHRINSLLAPDGAMLLAIENQLGLKYLLGYSEDHVGLPWVGLEDYPGNGSGVRTYSRQGLLDLLSRTGFAHSHWLYPCPDYKLPSTILSHHAYHIDDAAEFIDQVVRTPVRDHAHPPSRFCDERLAHRLLVAEGLGPSVANSFLVLAGRSPVQTQRWLDGSAISWSFGGDRKQRWLRHQVVHSTDPGLLVAAAATCPGHLTSPSGWLRQDPHKNDPYLRGPTLEQQLLAGCRRHDLDRIAAALVRWRQHLDEYATPRTSNVEPANPFLTGGSENLLPDNHVDLCLSNFVAGDEQLTFIDNEWIAQDGVDRDLVMLRALWYLAHDLVLTGIEHPWSVSPTVDDLVRTLAEITGIKFRGEAYGAFHQAEAQLQAAVCGARPEKVLTDLESTGQLSRHSPQVMGSLPFTSLQRQLGHNASELAAARDYAASLEHEVAKLKARVAELEA